MSRWKNFKRLIRLSNKVFHANRESGNYHYFVQKRAKSLIRLSKELNESSENGILSDRMFKKIQWYMVTHLLMGEMFAEMENRTLTEEEEMRFIILGPVLGLSDILIDDFKYDGQKMNKLLLQDNGTPNSHGAEQVFSLYTKALFDIVPPTLHEDLKAIFKRFHQSQVDSLDQFDPNIDPQKLEDIILEKGGTSVLLCRAILPNMTHEEENAYYQIGGLMQKMNDAVDLHKDGKEGLKTSATILQSTEKISKNLLEQKNTAFDLLQKMPFPKNKIEDFMFVFHVYVVSVNYKLFEFSKVCGGTFDFEKFMRLDKQKVRSQPFSIGSLRFCFNAILNFEVEN